MNRALSLFAFLPIVNLFGAGCSNSDGDVAVGPVVANPALTTTGGGNAGSVVTHPNGGGGAGPGPAQFCLEGGCSAGPFRKICDVARTTLIKDALAPDDASNAMIQQALVTSCSPAPIASSAEKGAPGTIDPRTGRPMAGPDHLLTIAGGAYVQKTVEYLDLIGATPLYLVATSSPDSWQYIARAAGGAVVAELLLENFGPTHDIFVVEFVRDPSSGTPVLIVFGQEAESTTAAAWYVAHQMIPNRASYDKSWYVYEWTGSGDAGGPATYALKASGSI